MSKLGCVVDAVLVVTTARYSSVHGNPTLAYAAPLTFKLLILIMQHEQPYLAAKRCLGNNARASQCPGMDGKQQVTIMQLYVFI